jgi:hypothetical protein
MIWEFYTKPEKERKEPLSSQSYFNKVVNLGHQVSKARISDLTLTKIEPIGSASNRTDKKCPMASLKSSCHGNEALSKPMGACDSELRIFHE